ncbi:hypothetical protein KTAU_08660 [Thermogemmatispora aurantia]|uniref:Uncharacterized protein n=1 Tax=Thermogemmatispora aurantia TaxID=2045279 RepID=A0A5J4JYD3_9CHLR|nr:hypothetical protein KTAU_08660 [Thermogemmatispora aurantia]
MSSEELASPLAGQLFPSVSLSVGRLAERLKRLHSSSHVRLTRRERTSHFLSEVPGRQNQPCQAKAKGWRCSRPGSELEQRRS